MEIKVNDMAAVSPESVGIPSQAVLNFIDELEFAGLCMHGFIMVKDRKVFAEGYYAPFHADFPIECFQFPKVIHRLLLDSSGRGEIICR